MDLPTTYALKFDTPQQGKPRSEREEMLDKFLERLNPTRIKEGFRPLTHARLAKLFEKVPTEDLFPFFNECSKAKSFGGLFWYKMRPKPSAKMKA